MKIQLVSDLHLERYPGFHPQAVSDADVLVLAGDIGSYQTGSLLATDDFGLARFSPRMPGTPWKTVLFVPGNHEYDGLEFDATHARLRQLCNELGITWLDQRSLTIDGVRFIGTTLWSDFDALVPPRAHDTAAALREREKAFRAANFYLRKNTTLRGGAPLLAPELRELGVQCQQWLRGALAEPHAGRTVVVTHFAPTLRSADPRYGLTPGTAGFCNALDELFVGVDLWLHGHLHCPHDYWAEGGARGQTYRCRVVANPRGYASKGEQAGFRDPLCIDLPDATGSTL